MKKTIILSIALAFIGFSSFAQWYAQVSNTVKNLTSVSFVGPNNGYAVGDIGTILKTNDGGSNWDLYTTNYLGYRNLRSVSFINNNNGFAVGQDANDGTILQTTTGGAEWHEMRRNSHLIGRSVFMFNENIVFVAGDEGKVAKTMDQGLFWNTQAPGYLRDLYSVYFTGINGYAVGWDGIILRTSDGGENWSTQSVGLFGLCLFSVYFPTTSVGYAVGSNGTIVKSVDYGITWYALISGTTNWLRSVYFTNDNTGYVVGDFGLIMKTTDGGLTWYTQTSGTTENLTSVTFADANTGYIVGGHGTILKTINGGGLYAPTVSTAAPTAITANSAILGGNITNDGGANVTARGVCIAYWDYPDLTDSHTSEGTGNSPFTSAITDLILGTTYHVRAYATNSAGTSYGNDVAFTTVCPQSYPLPLFQGFGTSDLPSCWTQVDHQGNGQVWQFGAISGYTPDPALNYNYAFLNSDGYGIGQSQNADLITPPLSLSGYSTVILEFNYYFRSWPASSGKVLYSFGNSNIWTTLQTFSASTANPQMFSQSVPVMPGQSYIRFKWNYTGNYGYFWAIDDILVTGSILSTILPASITNGTAISGGNITSDGGAPITVRGVCWGISSHPVVTGSHTTDGSGTGYFNSNITGLSAGTTYHARAYATNINGTFYGDDVPFTTSCVVSTLPFVEGFATTSIPDCWSQTDIQGNGQLWQFGVISGYPVVPALSGNYAFLNSKAYGSGNIQDVNLVSPSMDLSGYSEVTLRFNHVYVGDPESTGSVFYSINNGSTWYGIQNFYENTANPAAFSMSIPEVAGHSQVSFKWNYFGTWSWYWAIDDIRIVGVQPNKAITNITIAPGTTSCYNAQQTITVAGSGTTFTVQNGGDVTLVAGQNIRFLPGAKVDNGGHLWGYITTNGSYCVTPSAPFHTTLNTEEPPAYAETSTSLFSVYPNPTTGKFTLELNTELNDVEATVRIYGLLGDEVLQENLAGSRKTEFSLSERPNGVFIIRVMMGGKMGTAKIIKQE